eukprot:gnl/TRDRNA2_/TRDRNA2_169793_c0_seq4.p1 gnl/TRDRNA2_/TRDRNA2_169793_c0~~gnl/TRDRNA2_/TRDRNA2_169793_c0_seq4.p1  ORF type:complete len:237 (+),score=51.72 gnl/TRDRNA2_/TRDRNA2_169793_c0_seq4:89-799(+)
MAEQRIEELEKQVKSLQQNVRCCLKAANFGTPDFEKGKPSFAFLALKEHPYARNMLALVIEKGFLPKIVIQEDDGKIAQEEREKFEVRIADHNASIPPTIADQCAAKGIELVEVPHHNLSPCLVHLQRVKPRLIVLGGTRIIRDPILSFPVDGVVNAHPGLLPECRGSASPAWSVYHDIKVGSTCHICSAGIDEGDLLIRREVPVKRGYKYSDLCYYTLHMSGVLMAEAKVQTRPS